MGRKSMRWADGFIAVDWGTTNRRAYRIDRVGQARRRVRGRQGRPVGPARRLSRGGRRNPRSGSATSRCCLPEWSARTAAGKRRPMCRCPAGLDDLAERAGLGRASARRSFPAFPTSATGAPTSCAARRFSCSAPSRPGWSTRRRWSAIPGTHNKWATLRQRQDQRLPDGHDRRAVQPAQGAQHPLRPAPGRGRGERRVQATASRYAHRR